MSGKCKTGCCIDDIVLLHTGMPYSRIPLVLSTRHLCIRFPTAGGWQRALNGVRAVCTCLKRQGIGQLQTLCLALHICARQICHISMPTARLAS